jgi:hypothetical protein
VLCRTLTTSFQIHIFVGNILPWLRSIDDINTHDAAYELAIAGRVTTALILPGSANNIGRAFVNSIFSLTSNSCYYFLGNQSFVIKL